MAKIKVVEKNSFIWGVHWAAKSWLHHYIRYFGVNVPPAMAASYKQQVVMDYTCFKEVLQKLSSEACFYRLQLLVSRVNADHLNWSHCENQTESSTLDSIC